MSDHAESAAIWWRVSTAQVVLMSTLVVPLIILIVAPVFGGSGHAVATVGFVLAEALVLYVGYGALMQVVSPTAHEILVSP